MADDLQSLGGRKSTATSTALRPPEQGLKCPRCDSPNTKFCYYNNYSLHQPRHFCKTCRRYWTKGGALRNVPVGGGCRKNKKSKSMASSRLPLDPISGLPETSSSLKFLNGMPSSMPMDFQIGLSPVSRLHAPSAASRVFNSNQLINFRDISPDATFSSDATPAVGFNYPISGAGMYNEIGGTSSSAVNNSSIVSSIESLSSINQDLHWKLQQQRLAMLFGGEAHKESNISRLPTRPLENQQELLSSEVAERPIDEVCVGSGSRNAYVSTGTSSSTAWFLGSSYTMPPPTSIINSSSSNVYGNANNGAKSSTNFNTSYWNGVSAWNDTPQQFTALP